jgi:hypothetical protein
MDPNTCGIVLVSVLGGSCLIGVGICCYSSYEKPNVVEPLAAEIIVKPPSYNQAINQAISTTTALTELDSTPPPLYEDEKIETL